MFVYLHNQIVPAEEAKVSVFDRGLQYGDGFFETIRVDRGHIYFLSEHLARLRCSCRSFKIELPERRWDRLISGLLRQNRLLQGLAAVKILVTRGDEQEGLDLGKPENPTIVIYVRPYRPPEEKKYEEGFSLVAFPHRRHSFLASHKSANYLFYLTARDWAQRREADEAIILNGDGSVSECATANIFYRRNQTVFIPQSSHYLEGTTEAQVKRILEKMGYTISSVVTATEDLQVADEAFITNSLMGVMPVAEVDNTPVPLPRELPRLLQRRLFARTVQPTQ